ncbi:MAG: isochorismatase family protein [Rhizonema sp. PD37]|nr:isochorismatase family protein [Rhizonema sp. PD37]
MLDRNQVQVLFADLQTQIVQRSKTNPPEALSQSAAVLANIAKLFSLPMHLSVVPEGGMAPEVIEELATETIGVPQFLRMSASPFMDEKTRIALSSTGRRTLIIAGFATEVVVLHAVQEAIAAGYQVYVPVDACGGMSARTEKAAFREIEAAGGVTTSVVTLATAMAPDFTTELGQQMFAIVQKLRLQ